MNREAEEREMTEEELMQRLAELELQEIARCEEISWRQKSRCMWLKQGTEMQSSFIKWLISKGDITLTRLKKPKKQESQRSSMR